MVLAALLICGGLYFIVTQQEQIQALQSQNNNIQTQLNGLQSVMNQYQKATNSKLLNIQQAEGLNKCIVINPDQVAGAYGSGLYYVLFLWTPSRVLPLICPK